MALNRISDLSSTAASNTDFQGVSVAEGMSPAGVNNAMRALAAMAKDERDLLAGTTAGSANAYTFAPATALTAYIDDQPFILAMNHTNTGAATLNVSALGAKDIKKYGTSGETDVVAGDLYNGSVHLFRYDAAGDGGNGCFVLISATNNAGNVVGAASSTDNALTRFDGTGGKTVQNSGTTLDDAGLLTLAGALNGVKGSDIASATTTDIGAATGNVVDVTGTTTITGLGTIAAGVWRVVRFTGALTLTHNGTSLILPGAANITTAANDCALFVSLGSGNWYCAAYQKASGRAVVSSFSTYESSDTAITASSDHTFTHSLGSRPKAYDIRITLKCETTDRGYAVGDEVDVPGSTALEQSGAFGITVRWDDTDIIVRVGTTISLAHATTGTTLGTITLASWKLKAYARVAA